MDDSAQTRTDTLTVFEAASLSKPVFAYIVMRLADRKQFDLDRPLADVLPYPRLAQDPRYKRITARMVLSHSTGLPNWGGDTLSLRFDPGTEWQYSGEGFVYLQKTVERATGHSLEELAQREVFAPLGMTRSSYVWQTRFTGNAAYAKDWAWRVAPIHHFSAPNAAYSLVTTAGDYAKFVVAVINGTELSQTMSRTYLTPVRTVDQPSNPSANNPHIRYSLGWGVEEGGAATGIFHGGYNGRRFTSWVEAYPSRKTGIVYIANGDDGADIADALLSHVITGDHYALRWERATRYDDPRRLAVMAVKRAAIDGNVEAALARYRAIRSDPSTRPSPSAASALIEFLNQRGFSSAERPIAEMTVRDFPDSAGAHDLLAGALLMSRNYDAALGEARKSLAIQPDDPLARRLIAWIDERIASIARPVTVPEATLRRYVGRYGERRVSLRDGRLIYQQGSNPERLLTPITGELFAVEGDEASRLRFVHDGIGPASATLDVELRSNSFYCVDAHQSSRVPCIGFQPRTPAAH